MDFYKKYLKYKSKYLNLVNTKNQKIQMGGAKASNDDKTTIYLFKAELDSNNSHAAVQILAKSDGTKYLAKERYEMQSEMERLGRILANRTISLYKTDTLQIDSHRIILEFDYLKTYIFTTKKIDNQWYIVDIQNDKQ